MHAPPQSTSVSECLLQPISSSQQQQQHARLQHSLSLLPPQQHQSASSVVDHTAIPGPLMLSQLQLSQGDGCWLSQQQSQFDPLLPLSQADVLLPLPSAADLAQQQRQQQYNLLQQQHWQRQAMMAYAGQHAAQRQMPSSAYSMARPFAAAYGPSLQTNPYTLPGKF